MAKIPRIQFKRTTEKGKKPTLEILESGELAINLADKYLFTKDATGEIINLSSPPVYEGDVSFTGLVKGQKAFLGKTADYSSYEAQRDLSKFGAFRTNQMDGFDALILNIPHPSASLGNYAHGRGLEFQYGHVGNKVFTYGFNANGEKAYKFRMYHEGDKPTLSELNVYSKNEIDNVIGWDRTQTKIYTPEKRYALLTKNTGEMIWYDTTTNTRMVNFGGGGMDLAHKVTDYVGISLYKKDTNQVRLETEIDSSNAMLNIFYKDSANKNLYQIRVPKENSVLATQNWVDGKYYKRDDSPTFKGQVNIGNKEGGNNYAQLSYEQNEARWSVNTGSWKILKHPNASGIVATREWSTSNLVRIGTGGSVGLHNYNTGGHGYSTWNENNVRQAYIGFGSDGVKEFTINNEKTNGSINLRAKDVQTNGSTIASQPWVLSNFYRKTETYNKSEIDGKVNGRLTQAQGDGRYALNNFFEASGGESRIWNGSKNHYLFVNNNLNSGLYNHSGGKYVWGFNSTGQMTAGLVPVSCGGTGAKDIGTARNNLQVYSKGETYSRAEVDSRVNGRLTQATADGRYAYKGGATGQNFGANIVDAADVNIRSDISVKSNLVYIKNALDLLKPLTGYKYDLRLNDNTHKQSVGIIAQDVQKVLPELVQKDSTDLLSVNYNGLTAVLINAVNELNIRLKELEVKKWQ